MRNLLLFATSLTLLASAACTDSLAELPQGPVLKVISPERSTIRSGAGQLVVTGTVQPNEDGSLVKSVKVNDVPAVVGPDGSFQATININPGATLVTTEAVAENGGKATDTRSVEAGELRMPGANIENALSVAISKNAFSKIAGAASGMIKTTDFKTMLAPMNPMVHVGDENGEDCLFARAFIDDFKMSNATITMVPVNGGLSFSAKLDGLDVPGRMRYAALCANGSNNIRVTATSVTVKGTLVITPDGMKGFKTSLSGETVNISGLNISASGIPGAVLDILPLDTLIEKVAPVAARMFMEPMMNKALGGLAGPKTLMALGKTITVEVDPSDITFDAEGGLVSLDMKMLIGGTENSKGFIFTDNGYPSLDPGDGMMLGLADDLANSMLSQLVATGLLEIQMPAHGGTFDGTSISMTSPPMVSADPANGMMHVVLPDMMSTFTLQGRPVGKAAINATLDLKITPSNNGYGIAIELGEPEIHANVVDDIPNETLLADADLGKAVELALDAQIASISALLGSIPLPTLPGGLQMKNMSVSSDDGYVIMAGTVE
jgi:hypothetical protein